MWKLIGLLLIGKKKEFSRTFTHKDRIYIFTVYKVITIEELEELARMAGIGR